MSWILVAVIIIAITAIVLRGLSNKSDPDSTDFPYQRAGALFSPAERSFYGVLRQVVGNNANIFGKVRVADVVMPRKGLSRSDRQKAFNKISGKTCCSLFITDRWSSPVTYVRGRDSPKPTSPSFDPSLTKTLSDDPLSFDACLNFTLNGIFTENISIFDTLMLTRRLPHLYPFRDEIRQRADILFKRHDMTHRIKYLYCNNIMFPR